MRRVGIQLGLAVSLLAPAAGWAQNLVTLASVAAADREVER